MTYLAAWLVPIAFGLGVVGLLAFLWSMRSGQHEDLDGAAERVLLPDTEDAPLRRDAWDSDESRNEPPSRRRGAPHWACRSAYSTPCKAVSRSRKPASASNVLVAFAATFATRLIASAIFAWVSADTASLRPAARVIAVRSGLFPGRGGRLLDGFGFAAM